MFLFKISWYYHSDVFIRKSNKASKKYFFTKKKPQIGASSITYKLFSEYQSKTFHNIRNNLDAIPHLRFGHDQWWSKANFIAMRWFSQKAIIFKFHANIPS